MSSVATVLSTPKFLNQILSLCDQKSNASSLLVNKIWAEEVLTIQWRNVDRVEWLLGLLAPLVAIEPDFYAFSRSLEAADWERFYRYAPRVEVLVHQWNMFDASVYAALSSNQNQRRSGLLPNVHHITCLIDTDSLSIFLRPGLQSLTLCYDLERYYIDYNCLQASLALVAQTAASSLTELTFNYQVEDDVLVLSENILVSALREMKKLRTLDIPPHWLSERVTQCLAALPSLRELEADSYALDIETTAIVPTFSTSLDTDSFPFLNDLSLTIPFEKAGPSFTSWGRSARLHALCITSECFEHPEEYTSMVAIIVKTFPSLQKLSVHADSKDIPPNIPAPHLTFHALKPILRLRDLDTLRLSYTTPLNLTESDLSEIFWELESITVLELNPTPPIRTTSSLHLTCLTAARFAGSHIQSLRLYVDTSLKGFDVEVHAIQRLEFFDCLDVGYSALSRESLGTVVEYLSLVLPEGCKIKAESPGERRYEKKSASLGWKRVCSVVPALTRATRLGDIGEVRRLRIALNG